MRTAAPTLAPVFRSDQQLRILASLFLYGGEWTVGELADHAEVSLSTASREIHRLVDAGLASLEPRGQLRFVRANMELPWVRPLVELIDQTVGPVHHLRSLLNEPQWAIVKEAHLFGSWARRYLGESGTQPNDLDVVLVSTRRLPTSEILRFQRELQDRVHLPVDAFSVTEREWSMPEDTTLRDLQRGATVLVRPVESSSDTE